jgi:hypothetical protein
MYRIIFKRDENVEGKSKISVKPQVNYGVYCIDFNENHYRLMALHGILPHRMPKRSVMECGK